MNHYTLEYEVYKKVSKKGRLSGVSKEVDECLKRSHTLQEGKNSNEAIANFIKILEKHYPGCTFKVKLNEKELVK